MTDEKKDDENVPRIGKEDDEDKSATQRLDLDRPPTHFAIPADKVQEVIEFLENEPWKCTVKQAVRLMQKINTGTPLVLGPKANQ